MAISEWQVSSQDKLLFRSDWEEARKLLEKFYLSGIPVGHATILEDLYKIRSLYVREGNIEQLVGQQREFMEQYDSELDKSPELISAVGLVTMIMGRG